MENIENKELTAEEIMAKLRLDLEVKNRELEQAKKEEKIAKEKHQKAYRRYNKIPEAGDMAIVSGLIGGAAATIGGFVSKFIRDGANIRRIDDVREYFTNHPDAFEWAKDFTGLTDLDAISGYALGTDSAASALFTGSGLQDFFWNNTIAAIGDAGIILATLFVAPTVISYVLGKVYDKKSDKTYHIQRAAEDKRLDIWRDINSLEKELKNIENAEEEKKKQSLMEIVENAESVRAKETTSRAL